MGAKQCAQVRVLIRPASPDQVDEILSLWRAAYDRPRRATDDRETLTRLATNGTSGVLVAVREERVVGTVIAGWDGWRGNLYRLAVAGEHRRQGIARALVRAGEEHLRRQGARHASALVAREDVAAVAVWAPAGYQEQTGTARFVKAL